MSCVIIIIISVVDGAFGFDAADAELIYLGDADGFYDGWAGGCFFTQDNGWLVFCRPFP